MKLQKKKLPLSKPPTGTGKGVVPARIAAAAPTAQAKKAKASLSGRPGTVKTAVAAPVPAPSSVKRTVVTAKRVPPPVSPKPTKPGLRRRAVAKARPAAPARPPAPKRVAVANPVPAKPIKPLTRSRTVRKTTPTSLARPTPQARPPARPPAVAAATVRRVPARPIVSAKSSKPADRRADPDLPKALPVQPALSTPAVVRGCRSRSPFPPLRSDLR